MPNMGFTILDYSSGRRILDPRLEVLVPKAANNQDRDRRMFFRVIRNLSGDMVALDTPPGIYDVIYAAPGYVTERKTASSPMLSPETIELHRSTTFPFTAEDTLLVGEILSSVPNVTPDRVKVQLVDPTPTVKNHTVPVYLAKDVWQYVIYVPEKKDTAAVSLKVTWPTNNSKIQPIPSL